MTYHNRFVSSLVLLTMMAVTAAAQCYEFSGPNVSLKINITSIVVQTGPTFVAGGYTTNYDFSSDNTLTLNGAVKTSKSFMDGLGNIQYIPGAGGPSDTTFELSVPSFNPTDTPGPGEHSWVAMLAGNGNLIPSGVFPAMLPPIGLWVNEGASNVIGSNYDYIEIADGSQRTKYAITGLGDCSAGTSGGQPPPSISGVVSASAFGAFATVTPGGWVEIYGSNLAPDTRGWTGADFNGENAPTSLDGVSVSIDGQAAFVDFVSPNQVDVQLPSDIPTSGTLQLTLTTGALTTAPVNVTMSPTDPGLLAPPSFKVGANQYVTAQFVDGTYVLPTGAIAGINSRPAKPGETIVIYGVGFGPVNRGIPAGQIVTEPNQLAASLEIDFGQTPAQVTYYGLAPNLVGVYQFNVVVPPVPDSDLVPLTFKLGGMAGAQTLFTAVHQ